MTSFIRSFLTCLAMAVLIPTVADAAVRSPDPGRPLSTHLGIEGTHFTINSKPVFLYGISYYGALGASEDFMRQDLADMQRDGFNWIRVWANWSSSSNNVSAIDEKGEPRSPFLQRLQWLMAECDRRGVVVDVTLTRGNGSRSSPRLQTLAAHRQAVETLIHGLKTHANWYLDLSNERNVRDARFTSIQDLKELRDLVKQLDPTRLVTASDGGDISKDALQGYLLDAQLDFIAPHRPRDQDSPAQTEAKSREYFAWMKQFGRVTPLHYQEPFRRGYGKWQPTAKDYAADLRGAIAGGAAGWCFHNGSSRSSEGPQRSFDLTRKRLYEQLDQEELAALKELQTVIASRQAK
ncbi:MAG TPA: glycoside hydrolase family 2 TIM barrel-domain containing protein [Verrucomicrobiae bacterium]